MHGHEHTTSGEREALSAILADADPRNGDDCAVVELTSARTCVSSDSTVEGVHFPQGSAPREIGHFAAARALSDLAAAAASPVGVTCAVLVPDGRWSDVPDLVAGVRERCRAVGCDVVGGDVSAAGDGSPLALVLTVLGEPPADHPSPPRYGARTGDLLVVSGELGRAAAAFHSPRGASIPHVPDRLPLGRALAPFVTSMIDVSDGIARDAEHLARSSGCDLYIELDQLPLAEGCRDAALAATFGDDYELLCTIPAHRFSAAEQAVRADCGEEALTLIGRVADGTGTVHMSQDGHALAPLQGFEHGRSST